MERYQGRSIVGGVAQGPIRIYRRNQYQVEKIRKNNPENEIHRYRQAEEEAIRQLGDAYDKAVEMVGAKSASVFEMQAMLLKEERFRKPVESMIRETGFCAEYAVASQGKAMTKVCKKMEEERDRKTEADIRDIVKRLLSLLSDQEYGSAVGQEPVILMAREITPGELLQMDRSLLLGLVTETGTADSHTAVLAAAMQIPFVTGIPYQKRWSRKQAVVDGEQGIVIVEPDEACVRQARERAAAQHEEQEKLAVYAQKEDITLDGDRIPVLANIGDLSEMKTALQNHAAGIGLFRSEFLYMERETYPSEEEQFQLYRRILQEMQGKPVVIRTLDIGADKQVDYFRLENEPNPAMGYRGIRICLDREELFRAQLKALFRAASYGDLSVLYPMITSTEEVEAIQKIISDIQEEMDAKKIPWGKLRQGVMIETPAAVMISDLLAENMDFFSIGTNDLAQYTMAADRQNPRVAHLCTAQHPAVLRMIQMTVRNGHRNGIPVSVCGELAADRTMTRELIRMGVDALSVTPNQILPLRKEIRSITVRETGGNTLSLWQER